MGSKWIIVGFKTKLSIVTRFKLSRATRNYFSVNPKHTPYRRKKWRDLRNLDTSEDILIISLTDHGNYVIRLPLMLFLNYHHQCMITTWSGRRTSNQQEFSVLFSNISLLTSSLGKPQEIISTPVDRIQDPYLATLNLSTSEHIKL